MAWDDLTQDIVEEFGVHAAHELDQAVKHLEVRRALANRAARRTGKPMGRPPKNKRKKSRAVIIGKAGARKVKRPGRIAMKGGLPVGVVTDADGITSFFGRITLQVGPKKPTSHGGKGRIAVKRCKACGGTYSGSRCYACQPSWAARTCATPGCGNRFEAQRSGALCMPCATKDIEHGQWLAAKRARREVSKNQKEKF